LRLGYDNHWNDNWRPAIQINGVDLQKAFVVENDHSFTLKLPLTKGNARLFPALGPKRADAYGPFNTDASANSVVYINGLPLIAGQFVMQRSNSQSYEGFVRGERQGWLESVGKKKLRELDIKVPFRGGMDVLPTWDPSQNGNFLWPQQTHHFAPIGYGRWDNIPTISQSAPGQPYEVVFADKDHIASTYYEPGSSIERKNEVTFEDFPPQVHVLAVLEAAAKSEGYGIGGSFASSTEGRRLVISYSGGDYKWNWKRLLSCTAAQFDINTAHQTGFPNQLPVVPDINTANESFVFPDNSNNFAWRMQPLGAVPLALADNYAFQYDETEDEYTCLIDGRYSFEYEIDVREIVMKAVASFGPPPAWGTQPTFLNQHIVAVIAKGYETLAQLNKNGHAGLTNSSPVSGPAGPVGGGSPNILAWDTLTPKTPAIAVSDWSEVTVLNGIGLGQYWTKTLTPNGGSAIVSMTTGPVRLKKGDKVRPAILWRHRDLVPGLPVYGGMTMRASSRFRAFYLDGSYDLDLAINLPDKTVQDLMEDLSKIYNLRYGFREDTITIDYFNDYINSPDVKAIDLTEYVDLEAMEKYDIAPARTQHWAYLADEKDDLDTTSAYEETILRPTNAGTRYEYETKIFGRTLQNHDYFRTVNNPGGHPDSLTVRASLPLHADKITWVDLPPQEFPGPNDFLKALPARKYDTLPRLYLASTLRHAIESSLTPPAVSIGWCAFKWWNQPVPYPINGVAQRFDETFYYRQLTRVAPMSLTAPKYWGSFIEIAARSAWFRTDGKVYMPASVYTQLSGRRPIKINGLNFMLKSAQISGTHRTNAEITLEIYKI
jgi:hypothetical protein